MHHLIFCAPTKHAARRRAPRKRTPPHPTTARPGSSTAAYFYFLPRGPPPSSTPQAKQPRPAAVDRHNSGDKSRLTMLARLMARLRGGDNGGRRACYGIAATCAWLLLFCVLAVALRSAWKAFAFASLALVAFGAVDHFAPDIWCAGAPRDDAGGSERHQSTAASVAARRFGLGRAAIDALPTFAYGAKGGGDDVDLECGGDSACSVCLEDLRAGELVRRLPACRHVFHVECIDMWLHSHRSCPLCRCDLSPPRKLVPKTPTVESETPVEDALPAAAVSETGPPADDHDASPPVVTVETKPPAGVLPTV
ncbi:hypothetical protein CFC21_078268 [Triticum aestivum]|uniref:RING-type E3 ubiquitin transferase n=3 Tax=Triticum aestivum TaxID=4565 RepID=A0A9R1L0N4_WHEAT|nr:hypothetical protein CFC21_078268 [Triticum aestivum]